jgi:hypothetical protein
MKQLAIYMVMTHLTTKGDFELARVRCASVENMPDAILAKVKSAANSTKPGSYESTLRTLVFCLNQDAGSVRTTFEIVGL